MGKILVGVQHINQMIDLGARMTGIKLNAQPRLVHRNRWKFYRVDMHAFVAQPPSDGVGQRFIADHDRHDGRLRRYQLVRQLGHTRDEIALVVPQALTPLRLIEHSIHRRADSERLIGRQR